MIPYKEVQDCNREDAFWNPFYMTIPYGLLLAFDSLPFVMHCHHTPTRRQTLWILIQEFYLLLAEALHSLVFLSPVHLIHYNSS